MRRLFSLADVILVFSHYLPDLFKRLSLPCQPTPLDEGQTDTQEKLHCTYLRAEEIIKRPECQVFLYVLLQIKLIDDGDVQNVSFLYLVNSSLV